MVDRKRQKPLVSDYTAKRRNSENSVLTVIIGIR